MPAMTLNEYEVEACTRRVGDHQLELSAGENFKIEWSPNGEEILNYTVPATGATIIIYVRIEEHT